MKKMMLAALLALSSTLPLAAHAIDVPEAPHVITSGYAEVKAAPDMATLSFSVTQSNKESLAAKQQVDERVGKFLTELEQLGIAKTDIEAGNLITNPEYRYPKDQPRELTGYRATRQLTVRLNKLDDLSKLVDSALKVGINQVNRISYGVKEADKLKRKALQLAIKDSKHKASLLARSYDAKLGKVYAIEYQPQATPGPMPRYGMNMMAMEAKTNTYVKNDITFSDSIQVVFKLKE
ncbi:oxidative stress defense protein [Dongshaea marina]|uniref:oxidative stress defense protein n=1 Tax=Dongshaea marina TaxID=2047966 RepID=UPI00131F2617|nr:oxidative stress defense protein [Dongshaea marina]